MAERAPVRNPTEAPPARVTNSVVPVSTAMLDRKVVGNLTLEHCLYALLIAITIFTRLYIAGIRPLHHDESIHAVFSHKIVTEGPESYKYDPVYHGPVMYFWTALVFRIFGDSDFTSRLSPNLFGIFLAASCWLFRRYLGRWGALALLFLLTFSPSWSYFTRFLRHDIYVALFNVGFVYFPGATARPASPVTCMPPSSVWRWRSRPKRTCTAWVPSSSSASS